MEIKRIQKECNLADIDFEFVVDSSGSVGAGNWQITMDYIAQYWIQGQSYGQNHLNIYLNIKYYGSY